MQGTLVDKARLDQAELEVNAGSGGKGIGIVDKHAVPLFEVVTELPAGPNAEPKRPALTTSLVTGRPESNSGQLLPPPIVAPAQTVPGKIYIQRDRADTSGNAAKLIALLKAQGFAVVPQVEAMPREETPNHASVRFFNDADRDKAVKVAAQLSQLYGAAIAPTQIKLVAPPGQLEIWLPRVAAPPPVN